MLRLKRSSSRRKNKEATPSSNHQDLQILRLIDEGTAAKTGTAFFRELVLRLSQALGAQYAFISRFCDENTRVHVLAMWNGETFEENFDYALAGSPCEQVLGGDIVAYNKQVTKLFPAEKEDLERMNAESYLAIPLRNQQDQVLGHLAVIDTKEKNWQDRDFGILRIFAARATAEIERLFAEQELLNANAALARRVDLEGLIAAISTRFVSSDPGCISAEIDRTLGKIGQFIGSDRGLLYRFSADKAVARLTNDWTQDAAGRAKSRLGEVRRDMVPEVVEHFLQKRTVNAARPEDLPPGFEKMNELPGAERVASRIAVPVIYGNDTLGILCFHSVSIERVWPNEDLRLLGLLAEIMGSALAREQSEIALKEAKEAAESANRAKSEFLASMSHELRTPLNGVLGYAQLLKRDDTMSSAQLESVVSIERCGEHLLTLIGDVLDLAKIEAGRLDIERSSFSLDDFLRDIADIARVRATQSGLSFSYQTTHELPTSIVADERKLRQVLLNLLGNAVKFTDSGEVRLRVGVTHRGEGRCRLSIDVEDTGAGIPEAELERIFLPFHQVRQSDRRIEGTGLGLAICSKLMTLLGGTLSVRSEVNRGSTFTIEVDVEESPESACAAPRSQPKIIGYQGRRRRVLIADDKFDNRRILGQFLQSLGFVVTEALDGAHAVALASSTRPDLILMDLVMPVRDGFDATLAIRQMPDIDKVPIIAVSASAFEATRARCLAAGCDAFLVKPVRLDKLIELMGQLLELDWVGQYEEISTTIIPTTAPEKTDMKRDLPIDIARELYDLAMLGDVQAFSEKLERLRALSQGDTVIDELAGMARNFDMRGLRRVLKPLIEAQASSAALTSVNL